MKDLIEFIATSLVDDPTQVQVKQIRRGTGFQLLLQVAREDMGRVIGKQGRVANAMRTLLNVAAAQQGTQANLDIEEPR
ncbi:MAG: KH domain-containing protein [Anaerolineales bacterium]|jgi:predicted RNA-binding protein YlqC (UPF0109 family)|nr:KH domain-containing protein [Anaerolineales bacterium]